MRIFFVIASVLFFIPTYSQTINTVTTSPNPLDCQSWTIDVAGDKPMPQFFVASDNYVVTGSTITVTITWDAPPFGNPVIQPYLHTVTIPAQAIPDGSYTLVVENFFTLTNQITATNTTNNFIIGSCCPASADFSLSSNDLCWDDTLQVVDNSSGTSVEWYINGVLHQMGSGNFELSGYTGTVEITQYANDTTCADTSTQTVVFRPRPTTDFTLNVSGPNHTVTALGSSTFSYSWDFGDGNTANGALASHSYTSGGTYDICLTATDDLGCTADSCIQVVWSPVGLEDYKSAINIYPNPAQDRIVVKGAAGPIEWYSVQGRKIEVPGTRNEEGIEFNVESLAAGIYFISTDKNIHRVIIE